MAAHRCDAALLSDIKNYLNITWEDAETDKKIIGYTEAGILKINALTGGTEDYHEESEYKALLMDYCRLRHAEVPEKFEELFKSDLIRLRLSNIAGDDDDD